ncbi:AraC family transcriptional regulator [Gorillibacterium timonense]|uniref:AraC family transcriptional regulator n=1 Tax=Gorillibacterium timonense TaxID=1689269 RepID=UPI00071C4877|nr:AraC family transcriptional regulator [Gorillibacterium timonense]
MNVAKSNDCTITMDRNQKERLHHGSLSFPCASYEATFTNDEGDDIPWHWHDELELIFIEEGVLTLQTPSFHFTLTKGDGIFIHSGILHYAVAAPFCSMNSLLFHTDLICSEKDQIFYQKYLKPLITASNSEALLISEPSYAPFRNSSYLTKNYLQIRNDFQSAYHHLSNYEHAPNATFGVEFAIRNHLSTICIFLSKAATEESLNSSTISTIDTYRFKKMVKFIEEQYQKQIYLKDIAASANISSRECLRCFHKITKTSPIQYLLNYRLSRASLLLSSEPFKTVTEIAYSCGFKSSSYFTKMFRLHFLVSPTEYKKT